MSSVEPEVRMGKPYQHHPTHDLMFFRFVNQIYIFQKQSTYFFLNSLVLNLDHATVGSLQLLFIPTCNSVCEPR